MTKNYFSPYVTTRSTDERLVQRDVDSVFLDQRIIHMEGEFNNENCDNIRKKLMFLAQEDPEADINIYINSPGGSIPSLMSIVDTIRTIKPKVNCINVQEAYSCGAVLLEAATGKRLALPDSMFLLHQCSSGAQGKFTDMQIQFELTRKYNEMVFRVMSEGCGKSVEELKAMGKDDCFLTAQECLEMGFIDEIVQPVHKPRFTTS